MNPELNCPNCGAPKDYSRSKCEYCGTPYYGRFVTEDRTDLVSSMCCCQSRTFQIVEPPVELAFKSYEDKRKKRIEQLNQDLEREYREEIQKLEDENRMLAFKAMQDSTTVEERNRLIGRLLREDPTVYDDLRKVFLKNVDIQQAR